MYALISQNVLLLWLISISSEKVALGELEKKMDKLDTNYNELLLRVIKLEERLDNHIEGEKVWAY